MWLRVKFTLQGRPGGGQRTLTEEGWWEEDPLRRWGVVKASPRGHGPAQSHPRQTEGKDTLHSITCTKAEPCDGMTSLGRFCISRPQMCQGKTEREKS